MLPYELLSFLENLTSLAVESVLFCCVSFCMSVRDFIFSSESESAAALSTAFVASSRLSSGTYFKMSNSLLSS